MAVSHRRWMMTSFICPALVFTPPEGLALHPKSLMPASLMRIFSGFVTHLVTVRWMSLGLRTSCLALMNTDQHFSPLSHIFQQINNFFTLPSESLPSAHVTSFWPSLRMGQTNRGFPWWDLLHHLKLTDAEPDFLYTSDGLTNWRLLLGERCPGTRCQQTSMDGPRSENGDDRAMVTSPPRSPGSPQTDLRDRTPSPPTGPNNTSGNGPVWTDDAGLDNPAFEESTEEDSESTHCSEVKLWSEYS